MTRQLRMAISIGGLLFSACAFDLAHVTYKAATFQPTQNATRTVVLSDNLAKLSLAQECNDPVSTSHVREHDLEFNSYPLRTAVQVL